MAKISANRAFGITLDEFIECFSYGTDLPMVVGRNDFDGNILSQEYIENSDNKDVIEAIVKSDLAKIDILNDVFLKNVPDKYLISSTKEMLLNKFMDDGIQFFTWVEFSDHIGREFSFWFFPVVSFQSNSTAEVIDNTLSVVRFGQTIRELYISKFGAYKDEDGQDFLIDAGVCSRNYNKRKDCRRCENIRVTLVDYPQELVDLSENIKYLKRKNEIIKDNLIENEEICLTQCDNRFEQMLGDTDLLIFQSGEIGNAIYRAWVSTGLVKNAYTFVIHKKTQLPLWVGKSTCDPEKDESGFAIACKGIKEMIKTKHPEIRQHLRTSALITTNQVDACIRALSGLIQNAGMEAPVMLNLSTGTDTYPKEYSTDIKNNVLEVIQGRMCNFICFSIVDLFLDRTKDLIKYLKVQTGLPVIVGGIHAELYPDETIAFEGVDAICVGEAYTSFVNVLRNWDYRFEVDMPDFWFKKSTTEIKKNQVTNFFHNEDYQNIPIPDYSYKNYYLLDGSELRDLSDTPDVGPFKVEQHQIGHEGSVIYSSMGGCSNHCSFCNLTAQVKLRKEMLEECGRDGNVRQFRHKPLEMVKKELKEITKYNKNMKFLCIMENDFTCRNIEEIREYCEYIRSICKVPFYTMLAPNTINEEKLRVMIANNFVELNMGIQTNAGFNNAYYDRQIADEKILEVVNMISRVRNQSESKPYPFYDFINFNPEEPDESMKQTVELIKKFPVPFDFVIHHLTLGRELLLYERLINEKKVPEKEVMQTASSDYHNLNVDDYKSWNTLYMNLFLEWIAGSHTEDFAGRLPKDIENLKLVPFGKRLFEDEDVRKISLPEGTDIFNLFSYVLYPVLNRGEKRELLKELNSLLEPVLYHNQK